MSMQTQDQIDETTDYQHAFITLALFAAAFCAGYLCATAGSI